jgi:UDP-2-acetamido-2-deoxy-ribo-hexuluronate aminotransferase
MNPLHLPLIDLHKQYRAYKNEIDKQISTVLEDVSFIMGPQVQDLENELAQYTGMKHAIACGSGTDALLLTLMALDIKQGDEIITSPFTFIATTEVISFLGAKPVFVDIRPDTFNISYKDIRKAITPKTRAIIAVDMFGQCADYEEINHIAKDHNIPVIEDAAQSFGAKYKGRMACSLADIACTSFFPAKPLGCYGDGGMIFTNNDQIASITKSTRAHGAGNHKYEHIRVGLNSRLDTIQAAILLVKFKHFPQEVILRQKIASYYTQYLQSIVQTPVVLSYNESVYAQYNILVSHRDSIQKVLSEHKIAHAIYYPKPLHLQPVYEHLGYKKGDFPVTESVCERGLAIPMHPFLTHNELDYVIKSLKIGLNLNENK